MVQPGFHKIQIPLQGDIFQELSFSASFEKTGKGRLGNHLVQPNEKGIPIVRTTTRYTTPSNSFSRIHERIISYINQSILNESIPNLEVTRFNHALIEIYNNSYRKMKYHSDQCIDIDENSHFALFSCYAKPNELTEEQTRVLYIKNKETEKESKVLLTHNSVVIFSFEANKKYKHKIVLQGQHQSKNENNWLGITLRKSKTFIKFLDNKPYFLNGIPLKLATSEEEKEFFKLKGEENRNLAYNYPSISYTLSPADLMMPVS